MAALDRVKTKIQGLIDTANTTTGNSDKDLTTAVNALVEKVQVCPVLQDKIVIPTESTQTVTFDNGYDGLGTVTVNAMPTATQATPSITINASGLITATATQTAGYVAAGTKSATKQLAFQAAKTITPGTTNQTAVGSGYYTGGAITVKGDSNLVASNIKSGVSIFGVTGNYEGSGGSSGDTSVEDGFVTRTLTSYTNSRVTVIGSSAFCYCRSLTKVDFPNVTTINQGAFQSCVTLANVSFPSATYIEANAFHNCQSLITVSFPNVSRIDAGAFSYCSKLTTVNFPNVLTTGDAFHRCYCLTNVSMPKLSSVHQGAFRYCSKLTTVSFPAAAYIGGSAFSNCSNLTTIYLMSTSVCVLDNSKAFYSTKITSTTGSIFVPSSLVASYKTATNWTYFSNRIYSY